MHSIALSFGALDAPNGDSAHYNRYFRKRGDVYPFSRKRIMRKLLVGLLCGLLALTTAPTSLVALQAGQITGRALVDGKTLGNVTVRLRNVDNGQLLGTTTANAAGEFSFTGLPAGNFVVETVGANGAVLGTSAAVSLTAASMVATGIPVGTTGAALAAAGGIGGPAAGAGAVAAGTSGGAGAFLGSTVGIIVLSGAALGITAGIIAANDDGTTTPSPTQQIASPSQ